MFHHITITDKYENVNIINKRRHFMNEIKHNWRKWLYWFALGVALICIYKILDNYGNVMEVLNTFLA